MTNEPNQLDAEAHALGYENHVDRQVSEYRAQLLNIDPEEERRLFWEAEAERRLESARLATETSFSPSSECGGLAERVDDDAVVTIAMPALSPTMEEGSIRWLINEGNVVSYGDLIAEVETDKATMEIESEWDGVVTRLLVHANSGMVAVGTPLCEILTGEAARARASSVVTEVRERLASQEPATGTQEELDAKARSLGFKDHADREYKMKFLAAAASVTQDSISHFDRAVAEKLDRDRLDEEARELGFHSHEHREKGTEELLETAREASEVWSAQRERDADAMRDGFEDDLVREDSLPMIQELGDRAWRSGDYDAYLDEEYSAQTAYLVRKYYSPPRHRYVPVSEHGGMRINGIPLGPLRPPPQETAHEPGFLAKTGATLLGVAFGFHASRQARKNKQ